MNLEDLLAPRSLPEPWQLELSPKAYAIMKAFNEIHNEPWVTPAHIIIQEIFLLIFLLVGFGNCMAVLVAIEKYNISIFWIPAIVLIFVLLYLTYRLCSDVIRESLL